MGKILLENIRIHANHGCMEEEALIGATYLVNLKVWTNLRVASKTDELNDTVDYVHLNRIVTEEMAIRSKLLEHVNKRILDRIKIELPNVRKATICLSKQTPPINGDVQAVTVCTTIKNKT
jgi:7,8-dihydroneopterin aldolase/epimerase/oxygenase